MKLFMSYTVIVIMLLYFLALNSSMNSEHMSHVDLQQPIYLSIIYGNALYFFNCSMNIIAEASKSPPSP